MFDTNAPPSQKAIAEIQNNEAFDKLRRYAVWRTGAKGDAEDLLADAIECVRDLDQQPGDPINGAQ